MGSANEFWPGSLPVTKMSLSYTICALLILPAAYSLVIPNDSSMTVDFNALFRCTQGCGTSANPAGCGIECGINAIPENLRQMVPSLVDCMRDCEVHTEMFAAQECLFSCQQTTMRRLQQDPMMMMRNNVPDMNVPETTTAEEVPAVDGGDLLHRDMFDQNWNTGVNEWENDEWK